MANPLFSTGSFTILDGGMGTMLQAAGMRPGEKPEAFMLAKPDRVTTVHRAYIEAGAQVLCANTFGANPLKLAGSGIALEDAIATAVGCARKAVEEAGGAAGKAGAAQTPKALVALDVGPLGELLEPVGTLGFEQAYDHFATVMKAGQAAGADLVFIETMADLYEMKAAVLAAKECTSLPVLASMTFEEDGRTFSGTPVEAFAATIGGLGVQGLGINCSLGPADVMPLVARLCAASPLPVFAKPNAGLPNPATGGYSMDAEEFCRQMEPCLANGVCMVGGCCGTTPEFIRLLAGRFGGVAPARRAIGKIPAGVCGSTAVAGITGPLAIGERINPTGKKRLKEALQAGDLSYIQTLAVEQQQAGAAILDVNVGAPGVDEVDLLPRAVKAVQAVSGLPLQLDSANAEALAAALRVTNGKPVVNSTSGEAEKLQTILPLCARYGAAVVGLTLDENGIPQTAAERLAIAQKILREAEKKGIPARDVYIDCLTMAVGAQPEAAVTTLQALKLVKEKLGLKTVLGVSNVSFGLPNRPLVNRTFLTMALAHGLDLPIMNPCDEGMMGALTACRMLENHPRADAGYVERYANWTESPAAKALQGQGEVTLSAAANGQPAAALTLGEAIERGLKKEAAQLAERLLHQRPGEGLAIVQEHLMPALDRVGKGFEAKRVFLPQLLSAAGAATAAFDVIRQSMGEAGAAKGPPVVVATVQGDVHDLGKNIAKVLLENYGFNVIDLGRDVPQEAVVEAAKTSGAKLVGLSALMTTTLPAMEATIKALRAAGLGCKVLVGGAVLTEDYAKQIGADFFAKDATASADYARKLHGMA